MSVVGIDFGNLQSLVAVARNRGIDIITNEVSNRTTPSMVSFGVKQRYLGESAKSQEIFNFKNTVSSLKRLVGRSFQGKDIQDVESRFITAPLCDVNGEVGVKVQYQGSEHTFSATQLTAMYLSKLRETAANELKLPVSDVVISVPGWYTDSQRRNLLSAAQIAGLNCLRLMTDTAASALAYGITKTDLPEDSVRHVAFVDMGHSSYSVAIVGFQKGQLFIKSTSYDRNLGGRNFDQVLVEHFAKVFQEKHKIDIMGNGKASLRLRLGCEKLKKVLSANPQAMLNVENIMEDMDVSSVMDRADFEALIEPLLERMNKPLEDALTGSGLDVKDIDFVEVVGGCTRIPAVKQKVAQFFQRDLSFTLNQDEAVARGCALQCAILSPAFRVREFQVRDTNTYPIKFTWEPQAENPSECQLVAFPRNNVVPSTKMLTFYRRGPFDVEAYYEKPEELPAGMQPWIGRFTVKGVTPEAGDELATVKVRARLNIHGVLSVDSAYTVEEVIEEVPDTEAAAAQEESTGEKAPVPTKKIKKLVRKQDLHVVSGSAGLDDKYVSQLCQSEGEMASADKLVVDTEHMKNALEEYVYETRSRIEGAYKEFIDPQVRESYMKQLGDTEDWLYDEGDNVTKSVYAERLAELRKVGEPVSERFREAESIPQAAAQLKDTVRQFITNATANLERFAHIPEEEKQKVVERAQKAQSWLDEVMAKYQGQPKHQPLPVYARQISGERNDLVQFATPILSKPKPKPAKTEESPAATPDTGSSTPKSDKPADATPSSTGAMDVD